MAVRFWSNDEGAIAVLAAVLMPVLLSAAILATEVGSWAMRHQQMQGATDAASLAGVMSNTTGAALTTQGQALTAVAEFMHGVDGVTVQINEPPTSGPYMTRTDAKQSRLGAVNNRKFSEMGYRQVTLETTLALERLALH